MLNTIFRLSDYNIISCFRFIASSTMCGISGSIHFCIYNQENENKWTIGIALPAVYYKTINTTPCGTVEQIVYKTLVLCIAHLEAKV